MSVLWYDIYRNSKRITIIPPSVLNLSGAVLVQRAVPGINDWMPLSIDSLFPCPGHVHLSEVIQIYLPVMVKIKSPSIVILLNFIEIVEDRDWQDLNFLDHHIATKSPKFEWHICHLPI